MRTVAAAIVLAGLVAGCSLLPPPVGVKIVTPVEQLRVKAINSTSIPVVLVVNGAPRDMAPQSSLDLGLADLGALPWDFHVTTAARRELLSGTLRDGDVWTRNDGNGQGEAAGFLQRADLSCGQLILVAGGIASWGPAPGPGVPGDCD